MVKIFGRHACPVGMLFKHVRIYFINSFNYLISLLVVLTTGDNPVYYKPDRLVVLNPTLNITYINNLTGY
jgi:hypothetical protein